MKRILEIMLLATSLAGLTTSLRAQSSGDDPRSTTSDTGLAGGSTGDGKNEVKEPPGEPKGTNVTGAETNTETTVDPSGTDEKDSKNSAAEGESSGTRSEK